MKMIQKFLAAKHWQLFMLTFGIPMIFQFVMMGTLFITIGNGSAPDPSTIFGIMKFFPVLMILFTGVFFGWFWSVVIGLQKVIPSESQFDLKRFKIFFFIPLVYILFLSFFIGSVLSNPQGSADSFNPSVIAGSMLIVFPLHLFSMFCIFHSVYFVAKTFKTAELKRKVTFSDFAGEFFMVWFYPIGVWILQPKINNMIDPKNEIEEVV